MRNHVTFEADESTLISHLITVVRSTENSYQQSIMIHFKSIVLHLVTSNNKVQIVICQKFFRDICAESYAHTALAWMSSRLSTWITPEHLTERAFLWWFTETIDSS